MPSERLSSQADQQTEHDLSRREAMGIALLTVINLQGCLASAEEPKKETLPSLQDAAFDKEVLQAKGLALVMFSAEWCGYCKQMEKELIELQKEFGQSVKIVRMDTDFNTTDVPYRNNPKNRPVPYCIFFWDGKGIDSSVGKLPKETVRIMMQRAIDAHAAKKPVKY